MKPAELYWFLPLNPDGEFIGTIEPMEREPTFEYMEKVALAAEEAAFKGMLMATGLFNYHETWVAAAAILARTKSIRTLVAARPSQLHPVQFSHMAATLQNLFPGRLEINLVTGMARDDPWGGNFDDKELRYQRVREFMRIVNGIWTEDPPYNYKSDLYHIEDCVLIREPETPVPFFFSGAAPPARELAAEFADVYLMWGTHLHEIAEQVAAMRQLSAGYRRELRYGMRIQLIIRETEEKAWAAAERLISKVHPTVRELQTKELHVAGHVGGRGAQQKLFTSDDLRIGPNLWAGVGLGRWGVATALVGTPRQVVDRLIEYRDAGVDLFILSGYPKLEEAEIFGEMALPLAREAGLVEE